MTTFVEGLKYPWKKPVRLWNILWIFAIIVGWFALIGYMIRIVKDIAAGKKKALPKFMFKADMKDGFFMFFKMLPLMVVMTVIWYGASWIMPGGIGVVLASLVFALIFPYLIVNFFVKKTVASSFDIARAFRVVTKNFLEYLLALIYTVFYSAIYLIACVVLVGIPCLTFGRMYYLAEFYGKKR